MKKLIIFLFIVGLGFTVNGIAQATSLFDYYEGNIPTLENRAVVAEKYGVVYESSEYVGSYEQNIQLLRALSEQGINQSLGSFAPSTGYEERLTETISKTDTTIPVSTVNDRDDIQLPCSATNKCYFTLEPGTTREESTVCTGISSSSFTSCVRGLVASGSSETSSTTLEYVHNAGSKIIMTNVAQFFGNFMDLWSGQTASGTKTFILHPEIDGIENATTSRQLITLGQAQALTNQGAATSTESVAGISELATQTEMASSTPWGVDDPHVIQSQYATSTPSGTSNSGLHVPVSQNDGMISNDWIRKSDIFAWTGNNTYAGDETFNGTVAINGATSIDDTFSVTGTSTLSGLNIMGTVSTMTASTTFSGGTLPQPVYVASSTMATAGGALLADANDQDTLAFVGFAVTNASANETVYVQTDGIVGGFSSLSFGDQYYVQDSVGTIGTSIGTYEVLVGTAISDTSLLIQKGSWEYMGTANDASAGFSFDAPFGSKYAVIRACSDDNGASTHHASYTIFKTGANTNMGANNDDNQGGVTDSDATWSGNIVSGTGSSKAANACGGVATTIYWYR